MSNPHEGQPQDLFETQKRKWCPGCSYIKTRLSHHTSDVLKLGVLDWTYRAWKKDRGMEA